MYFATNWGLIAHNEGSFTLYSNENSELFDSHLVCIGSDPRGDAYLIAYEDEAEEKRITVFDGSTFKILEPGKDFPKALNEIQCLVFDDERFIIGFDRGFALRENGEWKVIEEMGEDADELTVYDVAIAGDTLWLGTPRGVVEWRRGESKLHETESLVQSVLVDDGIVRFGLSFEGIGKLQNGKITKLPLEEDIERIVRTSDGRLWAQCGTSVMNITDKKLLPLAKALKKKEAEGL